MHTTKDIITITAKRKDRYPKKFMTAVRITAKRKDRYPKKFIESQSYPFTFLFSHYFVFSLLYSDPRSLSVSFTLLITAFVPAFTLSTA